MQNPPLQAAPHCASLVPVLGSYLNCLSQAPQARPSCPSHPAPTISVSLNLQDEIASAQMGHSQLASKQPILVENHMIVNSTDVNWALAQLPLPAGPAQAPPDPHPSLCDLTCSQNTSQANVTSHRASSWASVGTELGLCGAGRAVAPAVLMAALGVQGCSLPAAMRLMSFLQDDKFLCERALIIFPCSLFQEAEITKAMMEVVPFQSPQQENRRKGRWGAGES